LLSREELSCPSVKFVWYQTTLFNYRFFASFFVMAHCVAIANAQITSTSVVKANANGTLTYTPDARGNKIPDFSAVGYHDGDATIPNVPVRITLSATGGDRLNDIQNAINQVSAMPLDGNGHRGAILLKKGNYQVSQPLRINQSGVVIRGEGNGATDTKLIFTAKTQSNFINIAGSGDAVSVDGTKKRITNAFVPTGAKEVTVEAGHTFKVGDEVFQIRAVNDAWFALIGMNNLRNICSANPPRNNWTVGEYTYKYKRKVVAVCGNVITLDAPVVDPIDPTYGIGYIEKYTWNNKISECGVENIRLDSYYASETDENHGWDAININYAENIWVNNVKSYYFGYGCVDMGAAACRVTVSNSGMFEYKSLISGSRRYGFAIWGQRCLVTNAQATYGRHDYVTNAYAAGPNVFYNCVSTNCYAEAGPHQRWATGVLWEKIRSNKSISNANATCSGTGHGWRGGQNMMWNCVSSESIYIQKPPKDHQNWAIGCTGPLINDFAHVEYMNQPIGFSLYEKQLYSRKVTPISSNCAPTPAPTPTPVPTPAQTTFSTAKCYSFTSRHSSLKMDVRNHTNNIGEAIIQNSASNTLFQIWRIKQINTTNFYQITNGATAATLSIKGNSSANSASIVQNVWANNTAQGWSLNRNNEGYYTMTNKYSNKSIDITGGSKSNNALIVQQSPNAGSYSQQWQISEVACPIGVRSEEEGLVAQPSALQIYPNPSTGIFYVALHDDFAENDELLHIGIYNTLGQLIHQQKINNTVGSPILLDIQGLPTGVQMVQVQNAKGVVLTKPLVVVSE
jgi:Ricin-type beta-trefoil lectin domain-like/Secretion system C-terminal sorting domain